MDATSVWEAALERLSATTSAAQYAWLRAAHAVSLEDGVFVLGAESPFAQEMLEQRFSTLIQQALTATLGRAVRVHVVVTPGETAPGPTASLLPGADTPASHAPPAGAPARRRRTGPAPARQVSLGLGPSGVPGLNPRYTFEHFIVGSSNRLAHAAALAVAEHPAGAYNPLFVYGDVGLGKTHLLHAIGHRAAQLHPTVQVLYVSCETFTNDFINSIRTNRMEHFRNKYRTADILLIDDIQFLAGKAETQEEFFHTFNTLHGENRQIVLSSDRPPREIATLEERLRSRFEWGLIADIGRPDFETRVAILRQKAELQRQHVPAAVLEFIAQRVQSNIRELEGSLTRVLAYASLNRLPLTPDTAAKALGDALFGVRRVAVSPKQVLDAVARYYSVTPEALRGKARDRSIVVPRHVAMYLMREDARASLPEIGAEMGGRDHTTAMHGIEKIAAALEHDRTLREQVNAIRAMLAASSIDSQA
jgi:chromosomal replication initiator protein